jgi:hypothetical protein
MELSNFGLEKKFMGKTKISFAPQIARFEISTACGKNRG